MASERHSKTEIAPTIQGKWIVLRAFRSEDRDAVVAARAPEFFTLVGMDQHGADEETSREFDLALTDPLHWAITWNNRCIGSICLHSLNVHDERAFLAIAIFSPQHWGKGFGTQATRLVLAHAFGHMGLHRIDLRVLAYNERAIRCYKKCGFVHEGILRENALVDGQWHDDVIMGILAQEFNKDLPC